MPGVAGVFTFERPRALAEAAARSSARRRRASPRAIRFDVRQAPAVRALSRPRAPRGRDRGHGRRRHAAPAPRTRSSASRSSGSRCPSSSTSIAAAEPGRAARASRLGHERGRRLHPRHRRRATRAFAAADVVIDETFRIQRYVGMPLETPRRGGGVGPPRRHAHDLEQHPGLALRPAGARRRARAAAPQDPRHRARPRRRLRHQGLRLSRGRADPPRRASRSAAR